MKRAIILLLDSLGVGASEDAALYGDKGANTLGHIIKTFPSLNIANLASLGILNILKDSSRVKHLKNPYGLKNGVLYGYAKEVSKGKDTPSGHWELMGCPVDFDWGYFKSNGIKEVFPDKLLKKILQEGALNGSLGNCIASGTEIINTYGKEHIESGKPIFYTSADSVFQVAAHEESFGLEELYSLCEIIREELYSYNIGRVIARPFIGRNSSDFKRTGNRRDYSIEPHYETLLDKMSASGGEVVAIGKISDIFAGKGITKSIKASLLPKLFDTTLQVMKNQNSSSIIFTNFVDFDSEYGHRRDVKGYRDAIEYFDKRLPEILDILREEDLLVIVADHGCDPTWKGTDHTREHVPVIFYNKKFTTRNLDKLETFADVGQSIATYLNLDKLNYGKSFL